MQGSTVQEPAWPRTAAGTEKSGNQWKRSCADRIRRIWPRAGCRKQRKDGEEKAAFLEGCVKHVLTHLVLAPTLVDAN